MRYLFFVFCFLFVFKVRAGDIPHDSILSQCLQKTDIFKADYVQTKTFAPDLSFISTGSFKFVKNLGLILKQNTPNKFIFVSTLEKYCMDGKKEKLSDLPYFSKVKKLIDDFLNQDYSYLNKVFDLEYEEINSSFILKLKPKNDKMAEFIDSISVYGDKERLQAFEMKYQNNMILYINFYPPYKDITDEINCPI